VASDSLNYVGPDGKHYSARVREYAAPTGSPKVTFGDEGSPLSFDANGFAPANPTGAVTYQWRFQYAGCGIPCQTFGGGPSYQDPISGATVTHVWEESGQFAVQLTATDSTGVTATTTFPVLVGDVPPTMFVVPDCPDLGLCFSRTGTGHARQLGGIFADAGRLSDLRVTINWGDGTVDTECISGGPYPTCLGVVGDPIDLSHAPDGKSFTFTGSHSYPGPGVYYGTVWTSDKGGASTNQTFVEIVKGDAQTIAFAAPAAHTYGDPAFDVSATGGGNSGFPVNIAVTGDPSVCSVDNPVTTGATTTASVTMLNAGDCTLTATQDGNAAFDPALPVTQTFTVAPAPVTINASSAHVTYGDTVPATAPSFSGFVNGQDESSLDTQPVCSSTVPAGGTAGTYTTNCDGAASRNYQFTYVPGTLIIDKVGTDVTLSLVPTPVEPGQPVTMTATVSPTLPGAHPGGTVKFVDGTTTISGCDALPLDPTANVATCTTSLRGGQRMITAVYSGDANFVGGSASQSTAVSDVTPPVMALRATRFVWPHDSAVRTLTVSQLVASVHDTGDPKVGIKDVVIEKVTSDEPDNAPGTSDGNTTNDIVIAAASGHPCAMVQLRSERDSRLDGRVYVITLRVRDRAGNTTRLVVKVMVPIDKNSKALQEKPANTVTGNCR
jgi:hypothetical protein